MMPSEENKSNRCHHECKEKGVELKINQVLCKGEGGKMAGEKSIRQGRIRANDGHVMEKKDREAFTRRTTGDTAERQASSNFLQAAGKKVRESDSLHRW